MDIAKIFSDLQNSLKTVDTAKTQFDEAEKQVQVLSKNYQDALKVSTDLRSQLDEALNSQMGKVDNRVRQS